MYIAVLLISGGDAEIRCAFAIFSLSKLLIARVKPTLKIDSSENTTSVLKTYILVPGP